MKGMHKVGKVLHEFKEGTLHSGSGQKVTSKKQAVAIALSEARKAGAHIKRRPHGSGTFTDGDLRQGYKTL